jgi:NADH-quinone oxidoreductase subunit J
MPLDLAEKLIIGSLAVAAIGLWFAMPQRGDWYRVFAAFAAALGLVSLVHVFDGPGGTATDRLLFWLFALGALASGVLMITCTDPVQGALWFAGTTLSVCGLFLQLSAPFLAAATVIVYAGAIIVTFMFVIMLAQQDGATSYDAHARFPTPAIAASFFLLGALAMNLHHWGELRDAAEGPALAAATAEDAHPMSKLDPAAPGDVRALGRSLFGDHLFAVELAGTLLLIATVGAIMMAPRRAQGTL